MYKPIRTKHHTHKILIAIHNAMSNFEEFKRSGPERNGICDRIGDIVENITAQHMGYEQLEGCFLTWEHFSGDQVLPIPLTTDFMQQWKNCPDKLNPMTWAYYNCPCGKVSKRRCEEVFANIYKSVYENI